MEISAIVEWWSRLDKPQPDGRWVHPEDAPLFKANRHSFNLDFPVSPYVGRIIEAPVIILGANAGYDPVMTPSEFPDDEAIRAYLRRVASPSGADWTFVSRYYDDTNYGDAIVSGRAVLINASPYRSRKISEEPDNRKLLELLPSTQFHRKWLVSAVLPMVKRGERRLVLKRHGLWKVPDHAKSLPHVYVDRAPVSKYLTGRALEALQD